MNKNFLALCALLGVLASVSDALAVGRTELRNICYVKGQEENTLRGLGLVVGLNGTGEAGDLQTMRALSSMMEIMGSPVSTTGLTDAKSLGELKKVKNVALVMVTATVPATGARRGQKIDCFVSALNGKSLEGGRLAFASLQGPNTQDRQVYALCQGQVVVDDTSQPMVGRIHGGCQMQQEVRTPFYSEDGYITLVLDHNHADFVVAEQVGHSISQMYRELVKVGSGVNEDEALLKMVQVVDAATIRVKIPEQYRNDPVTFVALLMEQRVWNIDPEARVVINPRAESIVISGDVVIGSVVITHRNLTVEAGAAFAADFRTVDQSQAGDAKLDELVTALKDLKVPARDIIEIIQGIEANGKLHGRLIIE